MVTIEVCKILRGREEKDLGAQKRVVFHDEGERGVDGGWRLGECRVSDANIGAFPVAGSNRSSGSHLQLEGKGSAEPRGGALNLV